MATNLLVAAGLAYALLGAVLILPRFGATVFDDSPAYPRFLARRSARQLDGRVGVGFVAIGLLATFAGAQFGYSAPLSLWRFPAFAAAVVLFVYAVSRIRVLRPIHRRAAVTPRRSLFESRRATGLRVAAEREAAALRAREAAAAPRDSGVVYLRKHWERRWWSDKLGVSAEAIEAAIVRVGPMSHDVRRHLEQRSAAA